MPLRTYDEAEAFLNGFVNYEKLLSSPVRYSTSEFDRDSFRQLLRRLGDPHLDYAVIHVAGTKGKGSTCAFLESILRSAGLRTGLYTSPHIARYTERIAVGGQPIADETFCELLSRLKDARDAQQGSAGADEVSRNPDPQAAPEPPPSPGFRTVFELLTAAAFVCFSEKKVDVAIIETGLGGRLDSTNVFDRPGKGPLVSVLTAIGLEHTAVLGSTVEKIAAEKAAIIQPHGSCVLAPQPAAWTGRVRAAVEARLRAVGIRNYLDADRLTHWHPVPSETRKTVLPEPDRPRPSSSASAMDEALPEGECAASFTFATEAWRDLVSPPPSPLITELLTRQPLHLRPSLPGAHQLDNLRTVLCTLAALDAAGGTGRHPVTAADIQNGVAATQWPGRFEILSRDPLVIVDGAHCPLSARAAADTFTELFGPEREVILVAGFLRDKPAEEIAGALRGRLRVTRAVACTPPTPRARPALESAEALQRTLNVEAEVVEDPGDAAASALSQRRGGQAVLILGSIYLIGPVSQAVRQHLAGPEPG